MLLNFKRSPMCWSLKFSSQTMFTLDHENSRVRPNGPCYSDIDHRTITREYWSALQGDGGTNASKTGRRESATRTSHGLHGRGVGRDFNVPVPRDTVWPPSSHRRQPGSNAAGKCFTEIQSVCSNNGLFMGRSK